MQQWGYKGSNWDSMSQIITDACKRNKIDKAAIVLSDGLVEFT